MITTLCNGYSYGGSGNGYGDGDGDGDGDDSRPDDYILRADDPFEAMNYYTT